MSKRNRAAKAQPDKTVQPRFSPTIAEARTEDLAGLAQLPGSLIATAAVGTLQAQAVRLGDTRLQTVQRQVLAVHIGRVQGNQHLQRVVACLKRDERGADPKPTHGQLVGNQAVQWLAWPAEAQAQQAITQPILSPRRSLYTPFVQKQDAEVTHIKFTEQEAIPIVAGELSEAEIQLALKYNKAQGYSTALIKMIQRTVGTEDDGILRPNTIQAIARWQAQKGLYPDGKVGPKTLAAISKLGGIPAPETAKTEAGDIRISFGPHAVKSVVSGYTLSVLKDILSVASETSATISSSYRDAYNQARIMYNNIQSKGIAHQRGLYRRHGNMVIDVYTASKQASKNRVQIIRDMEAKIVELGPSKVSRHCADPAVLGVIDVAPSSITNKDAFEVAVRADSRVGKFIPPPKDPGYHIEIPQK
jgi:peptidoglycan hydrolase-like protein with peptidoglycan-binding domain